MNFRKLCRIACVFFFLMFFQGNAIAATIHGTVYEWDSFKPLNNSVVEINSTPEQYFVATDSQYSFNLTPGTYLITANYLEGSNVVYTANEEVVISDKGEYVHDLLLFPPYDEGLLDQGEFELPNLDSEETELISGASSQNTILVSAFLALIVLLLAGYFLKKKHEKSPETTTLFPGGSREPYLLQSENPIKDAIFSEETENGSTEDIIEIPEASPERPAIAENAGDASETGKFMQQRVKPEEKDPNISDSSFYGGEPNKSSPDVPKHSILNLPEDLKDLLDVIRASGNRVTQRELRKKSPYSESKVSLMLSDLEERGLVEKFKRGRGNIIRIPDMHLPRQTEHKNKKE